MLLGKELNNLLLLLNVFCQPTLRLDLKLKTIYLRFLYYGFTRSCQTAISIINPLPDDRILDWSKLNRLQTTF